VPLLDTTIFAPDIGWRLAFLLGAILGLGILIVRRTIPESPRWLYIHGREQEGDRVVRDIESRVSQERGQDLPDVEETITIRQRKTIGIGLIAKTVFTLYPKRTILCFSLFVGQAFLYNAFFFTFGDVLGSFKQLQVDPTKVGYYIAAFAISNFIGPLVLGPFFDSVGRVRMIAGTYIISGILLAVTGFMLGSLNGLTLTLMGAITFFFASAGASAAYLTRSAPPPGVSPGRCCSGR